MIIYEIHMGYLSNTYTLCFCPHIRKLLAIYAEVGLENKGCPIISGDELNFYM